VPTVALLLFMDKDEARAKQGVESLTHYWEIDHFGAQLQVLWLLIIICITSEMEQ
jgi:hypothetical protein